MYFSTIRNFGCLEKNTVKLHVIHGWIRFREVNLTLKNTHLPHFLQHFSWSLKKVSFRNISKKHLKTWLTALFLSSLKWISIFDLFAISCNSSFVWLTLNPISDKCWASCRAFDNSDPFAKRSTIILGAPINATA